MELPPEVVTEIISYLPFKQAARLSLVAKRWKNLYREMKNIVFREPEFVTVPFTEEGGTTLERVSFVHRMHQWISTTFPGYFINRFEIHFPKPYGFQESITPLIQFAVSKQVKILVLDFSNPNSKVNYRETVFRLPGCVYDQTTTIESLKLISCFIDCTKFKNSTVLRSLTIGHVVLQDLTTLLSNFPSLVSLRFVRCSCDDYDVMIREFRFLHLRWRCKQEDARSFLGFHVRRTKR
ncbi:unnamed protein product [Microthlaspi erraticum]|uniref:F-box domain-containing protein n=1 Tax=Microthlaspi erraticum TaxID=1685480 RepID=A0A6D2IFZ8_9BRAS|nr:unnamed protein product [Microthlaspi erraticum]